MSKLSTTFVYNISPKSVSFEVNTVLAVIAHSGHILSKSVEKPNGQYLGLICDESLTCQGLNLNLGHFCGSMLLPLLMWRITFACLMVCR
jgi:hypothetical protein